MGCSNSNMPKEKTKTVGKVEEVPTQMMAWCAKAYGAEGNPADTITNLTKETVDVPSPKAGQVLIKVEMAAVNPIDWKLFSGGLDSIAPVTFPYVPGFDVAGTVVKLGEGVKDLTVGDKVCADLGLVETCCKDTPLGPAGAFAEYAVALASTVSRRKNLTAAQTVGLPLAGLTSYQALFTGAGSSFKGEELGKLEKGQKLLVLGGATATGALAIQLAKNVGATVAATASPNLMPDGKTTKIDFAKEMGADEVINYKDANWAEVLAGKEYDMIYDCVGDAEDWPKASAVLKKGGLFVSIANFGEVESTADHGFRIFLVKAHAPDLDKLLELVASEKLKVPVDSSVPFEKVPQALARSLKWQSAGKLCIQVSAEASQ